MLYVPTMITFWKNKTKENKRKQNNDNDDDNNNNNNKTPSEAVKRPVAIRL